MILERRGFPQLSPFALKFENDDLEESYVRCLFKVVKEAAGFDSIIEDEIRRCRFLIADLSDENAGAYWEAGFAEGLGKPVIYLCAEKDKATWEGQKYTF